jgi:DnaJ-class molecular chaperone
MPESVVDTNLSNYSGYYDDWDNSEEIECPSCYGTGLDRDEIYDCQECYGEGYISI